MQAWDDNRPVALQRYKEGEYQLLPADDEPAWDWPENNYAIIAQPVGPDEIWVVVGADMELFYEDGAKGYADQIGGTVARYRRVEE
jgi:hypothetical protein